MNKPVSPEFSAVPQYMFRELTDITPGFLERLGVRFLMLDLDNTIAAYNEHSPSQAVSEWFAKMKSHGIELFIISNSTRNNRVEAFSNALGAGFVMRSRKPSPTGLHSAINETGHDAGVSALVGDQVFTDTLAANRAGVISILVHPRRFTNPFLALRYYIEAPFRALCKNREK